MKNRVSFRLYSLCPAGAKMNDGWNPVESALFNRDYKLHVWRTALNLKKIPSLLQWHRASKWTEGFAMLDTIIDHVFHLLG